MLKNLPAKAGDAGEVGSIPGSGRSPGGGQGNPLKYSCLENPMDRGTCQATVHGAAKSWTWMFGPWCLGREFHQGDSEGTGSVCDAQGTWSGGVIPHNRSLRGPTSCWLW